MEELSLLTHFRIFCSEYKPINKRCAAEVIEETNYQRNRTHAAHVHKDA
ncbi:hypothetical protein TNCV_5126011, partial [Trichonephila clavipes]